MIRVAVGTESCDVVGADCGFGVAVRIESRDVVGAECGFRDLQCREGDSAGEGDEIVVGRVEVETL